MKKKLILIAEDDAFLTKLYTLSLSDDTIDVVAAKDGAEAIRRIHSQEPDLLILDLLMPKVDGFAVLEFIRKQNYRFPTVVLTNLKQRNDEKKCLDLGASHFLSKSDMDLDKLKATIHEMLGIVRAKKK